VASSKDPYFDYAEVLLQIAIVMATVSILSQSRAIFTVSLFAAICGALLGCNGLFLVFTCRFYRIDMSQIALFSIRVGQGSQGLYQSATLSLSKLINKNRGLLI
jgi:hypothetical protein